MRSLRCLNGYTATSRGISLVGELLPDGRAVGWLSVEGRLLQHCCVEFVLDRRAGLVTVTLYGSDKEVYHRKTVVALRPSDLTADALDMAHQILFGVELGDPSDLAEDSYGW